MSESIRITAEVTVPEPHRGAFWELVRQSVEQVRANEPGTVGYRWYASEDGGTVHLLEEYADAGAVFAHMGGPIGQSYLPQMLGISSMVRLEVHAPKEALTPETLGLAAAMNAAVFTSVAA